MTPTPFEQFIAQNWFQILTLAVFVGTHLATQKNILAHIKDIKESIRERVTKEVYESEISQLQSELKSTRDDLEAIKRRLIFKGLKSLESENG